MYIVEFYRYKDTGLHLGLYNTQEFLMLLSYHDLVVLHNQQMIMAERNRIITCGNFHGEYPAKVCMQYLMSKIEPHPYQSLDYLAIGVHELSSISERRIERLVHPGTMTVFYLFHSSK